MKGAVEFSSSFDLILKAQPQRVGVGQFNGMLHVGQFRGIFFVRVINSLILSAFVQVKGKNTVQYSTKIFQHKTL
jgi:hypothetical protein